jgi:hypothetical protein
VTEWEKVMGMGKVRVLEKVRGMEMGKVRVLEKVRGLVQALELHNPR